MHHPLNTFSPPPLLFPHITFTILQFFHGSIPPFPCRCRGPHDGHAALSLGSWFKLSVQASVALPQLTSLYKVTLLELTSSPSPPSVTSSQAFGLAQPVAAHHASSIGSAPCLPLPSTGPLLTTIPPPLCSLLSRVSHQTALYPTTQLKPLPTTQLACASPSPAVLTPPRALSSSPAPSHLPLRAEGPAGFVGPVPQTQSHAYHVVGTAS
jgi:hypothetical protein